MANFFEVKKKDYHATAKLLKEYLPELKDSAVIDIENNLRGSAVGFVEIKSAPKPDWVRWTLPAALVVMLLLLFGLPFKFMFTGRWQYNNMWLSNWFKILGLI